MFGISGKTLPRLYQLGWNYAPGFERSAPGFLLQRQRVAFLSWCFHGVLSSLHFVRTRPVTPLPGPGLLCFATRCAVYLFFEFAPRASRGGQTRALGKPLR